MTDGLTLKELLSRKKRLILDLLKERVKLGSPFAVLDGEGNVLLGESPVVASRHPVTVEGALIGWIEGSCVAGLASLISHLFLEERGKRFISDEQSELSFLYGLAKKFDDCLDYQEISQLILEEALGACGADGAEVQLLNAGKLEASAELGAISGKYGLLGKGMVQKIIERGFPEMLCLELPGGEVYAAMGVPFKAKDRIIGVVWMERQSSSAYSQRDLNFLNALAHLAARAIERRQVEARLIEARVAAEAADRAKSQFLANMSHEIRTPLNGILGMTELVLDTEMTIEQKSGLEDVRESASHLLGIVESVLDLSRIEGSKLQLRAGEFSLSESLCQIADLLAVGAHRKGLVFSLELPLGIPNPLVGDAGCLRQIVVNLVENAVKFTEKGEVSLKVKVERQSAENIFLVFTVSDTGCGIPPEKLTDVFDPFVQSDASFTRRHGGLGLGLSISKQLAEMMGGSIVAESCQGQGSTFIFKVPFGILAPSSSSLPMPSSPHRSGGSRSLAILLAEDNVVNQKMAARLLEKQGHRVTLVSNGEEALKCWENRPFDLILMDVQMPVMDGLEATLAIRRREKGMGRFTPIIAVTAHALKSDREQCLRAGMNSYVVKPIQRELLIAEIDRVLNPQGDMLKSTPAR